jgi:hypothetical protein
MKKRRIKKIKSSKDNVKLENLETKQKENPYVLKMMNLIK